MENLIKQKKLIKIIFVLSYIIYSAALTAVYFWGGPAVIPLAFILLIIECTFIWELRRELKEINNCINWEKRGF
jgi:fatty acid desaturase